jgi:hypothetical protein
MALKRPNAISFSKKNAVRPFEDAASLEFWSQKNDASIFVVGQSTKKRPDGLTFVRMFNHRVLDMVEVGVEGFVGMNEFKVRLLCVYFFQCSDDAHIDAKIDPGAQATHALRIRAL